MTTDGLVSVTAFTGGESVPSARFRVRALLPHLEQNGLTVTEKFPKIGKYPPASKVIRPFWFVGSTASRVPGILASRKTDITLLQREFVSTLFTLERMTKAPRVLDVDDAIHLHRKGTTARKLADCCEMILCGNEYLANWYGKHCSRVEIIPTSIDSERFSPAANANKVCEEIVRIGWTGLYSNLKYLYEIEDSLVTVLTERPNSRLKIISDQPPKFQRIAVVGSPVGVNKTILQNNKVGLSASNNKDWTENLLALIDDLEARKKMGIAGREKILAEYDSKLVARNISKHLKSIV